MATYVNGNGSKADSSGTTIAVTVTGVSAGNLVWALVKWEGTSTTVTISDGTSSFTQDALGVLAHGNGDLNGCMLYLLSSVASGSVTYTATLGSARSWKQMAVGVFSYSGTASRSAGAQGTSKTGDVISSGNFSPSGTELVAIGGWGNYTTSTPTNHLINAVADDGVFGNTDGTQGWYRLLTSGFTAGAASCDTGSAVDALGFGVAFSISASAGRTTKNTRSNPLGVESGMGFRIH